MKMRATTQAFVVSPPPMHAWVMLVVLGGLLPLAIIGAMLLSGKPVSASGLSPALAILPLVLAMLLLAMKRRTVELRDGVLDVCAALFRQRIAVSQLDLGRARIVDLNERTELRPVLKTGGMSLPGFQAGRFRLREKFGRAFCLVTDRRRVLWLPQRDGKDQLLLSLEQPQALLDALRD
jgi:hypothetical protein